MKTNIKDFKFFQAFSIFILIYLFSIHFFEMYTPPRLGDGMDQFISDHDYFMNILLVLPFQIIYTILYSVSIFYNKNKNELSKINNIYYVISSILFTQILIILFGVWFLPMFLLIPIAIGVYFEVYYQYIISYFIIFILLSIIVKIIVCEFKLQKVLYFIIDIVYVITIIILFLYFVNGNYVVVSVIPLLIQYIPLKVGKKKKLKILKDDNI